MGKNKTENIKEYRKKYYEENKAKIKRLVKNWKKKNPQALKKYRESPTNKEYMKKYLKAYFKKYPQENKEYMEKWRANNKEKIKSYNWVEYTARYLNRHPEEKIKVKARWKARNNIKIPEGQLCEICHNNKAKDRHHPDYNKPLKVMFLCRKCHRGLG